MKQETQNKAIKNPSKHLAACTAKTTQHFQTGKLSTHHSWFGYYFRRKVIKRHFAAQSKTLHTHRRLTNSQRQRRTWTIFLTPLGKFNRPRQVTTEWLQKFLKTEAFSVHSLTLGSPGKLWKENDIIGQLVETILQWTHSFVSLIWWPGGQQVMRGRAVGKDIQIKLERRGKSWIYIWKITNVFADSSNWPEGDRTFP